MGSSRGPSRVVVVIVFALSVLLLYLIVTSSALNHIASAIRRTGAPETPVSLVSLQPQQSTIPPLPEPTQERFVSPLPLPEKVERPNAPPLCVFKGNNLEEQNKAQTHEYSFGDFEVVATNTAGLLVSQWLPDSHTLLYTARNSDSQERTIKTLDLATKESRVWGAYTSGYPLYWLQDHDALAFLDISHTPDPEHSVLLHPAYPFTVIRESGAKPEQIFTESSLQDVVVDPQGTFLQFSDSRNTLALDLSFAKEFVTIIELPIDANTASYAKFESSDESLPLTPRYYAAQRGDGSAFAIYSYLNFYLYYPEKSVICEVDLGTTVPTSEPKSAVEARWSPDGRYLALITAVQFPGALAQFLDLTILDTVSGQQSQIDLGGTVYEIEWSPESDALLGLVRIRGDGRQDERQILLLTQIGDQRSKPLLVNGDVGFGTGWDSQMAWSSDGRNLAITCPIFDSMHIDVKEDRICVSVVETR